MIRQAEYDGTVARVEVVGPTTLSPIDLEFFARLVQGASMLNTEQLSVLKAAISRDCEALVARWAE